MSQTSRATPERLAAWIGRVDCSVEVKTSSDVRAIALMCLEADLAGTTPCNTWHMTAKFYGTACECVPCRRARA